MSDRDIHGLGLALIEAIKANDEAAGLEAAFRLLIGLLNDLHRIADAVEIIARQRVTPVQPSQPEL